MKNNIKKPITTNNIDYKHAKIGIKEKLEVVIMLDLVNRKERNIYENI